MAFEIVSNVNVCNKEQLIQPHSNTINSNHSNSNDPLPYKELQTQLIRITEKLRLNDENITVQLTPITQTLSQDYDNSSNGNGLKHNKEFVLTQPIPTSPPSINNKRGIVTENISRYQNNSNELSIRQAFK